MTNWLHCNKCFEPFQKTKNPKYFLSECGHITCEKCTEQTKTSNNCVLCNKPTALMQLSKDMEPGVLCYFSPLETQIKKCLEIAGFQNNHRESFLSNFQRKYEYVKQQCMKHYFNSNKLMQENKMLRAMLRSSGGGSGPVSSTPTGYNNASFHNASVSTISPQKKPQLAFGVKRGCPVFTPIKHIPGSAHRLSTSKLSNQSSLCQGISPAQVVPKTGGPQSYTPVHRPLLGAMSSFQDLRRASKFTKSENHNKY